MDLRYLARSDPHLTPRARRCESALIPPPPDLLLTENTLENTLLLTENTLENTLESRKKSLLQKDRERRGERQGGGGQRS
jgi:hypothetical protein